MYFIIYTQEIFTDRVLREITTATYSKGDHFRFINKPLLYLVLIFANLPILEIVLFELIISRITI